MKKITKYLLISATLLNGLFIQQICSAQESFKGFTINPKVGFYNLSMDNSGIVSGNEFCLIRNKMLYSADLVFGKELDFIGSSSPSEYFVSSGVMAGSYEGTKYFRLTYQAGLSIVAGRVRTDLKEKGTGFFASDTYYTDDFFTIGVPLKIGLKVIPVKSFSIGFDLQANLNIENPVVMPMISLEFGMLRE